MILIIDGNSEIGAHGKEQSLLFDLLKEFDHEWILYQMCKNNPSEF